MGRGQRAQGVVVVAVQVNVTVDQTRQHELAGGVDVPIGRRQVILRADGNDLLAGDGDGARVNL